MIKRLRHSRVLLVAILLSATAAAQFPGDAVIWTNEEPASYQSSETAARLFCSNCGSSIAHHWLDTNAVCPYVGTLDEPEAVTPEFHIFTSEQLSWVKLDDGLPRHAASAPVRLGQERDASRP